MDDVDCPRCGAAMKVGGVCPVCETPYGRGATPSGADEEPASTLAGRLWQSGQGPVAAAVALFGAALFLPLLLDVHMRDARLVDTLVSVRPWDLLMGTYPAIHERLALLLPGAALFLASLLRSRHTGPAMAASRPLVVVVALAPLMAVAMPFLLMHKHGQSPGVGAAALLVGAGATLGVFGGLRFGHGVPDPATRRPDDEDDEDDEDDA